jgi:DNA-binding NarL/FixJ family response regulator
VVVLDIHLHGQVGDSYPLIPALRAGGAAVVVLTGEDDAVELGRCVEMGAAGVATKDQSPDEVLGLVELRLVGARASPEVGRSPKVGSLRGAPEAEDAPEGGPRPGPQGPGPQAAGASGGTSSPREDSTPMPAPRAACLASA